MPIKRLCAVSLALLLSAGPLNLAPPAAASQNPPKQNLPAQNPPQQQEGTIRVQVSVVNLFASVRDKNKRMLADLTKDEFRIFEEGQEQKIEFFRSETSLPITLGLLVDTSGSQERILGAEQDAASRFLRRVLREKDLAMVITFDVDVDLLADFTNDRDKLERAINRARINAPSSPIMPGPFPQRSGGTNMYDAIYLACHDKLVQETGRKALILLTDANDTGSKVRMEEALEIAQRTDTVLHFIVISDRSGFGFGGRGDAVAQKMAEDTGGRAISVSSEKDLEKAFDQISDELRSQYTLGYYPANPSRDGKFRKLKVETTRKDTKVLTRKGYYAPKG